MAAVSRIGGRALAALLPDTSTVPGPVYAALARSITALVLDGRVATETRLPSERELAGVLGLSRATVSAAYDRLRETGHLTSRTGSGSFVTVPEGRDVRSSTGRWSPAVPAAGAVTDVIDLSCASLPAPPGLVERSAARVLPQLPAYTGEDGYSPYGIDVLREAVARRCTERGVPTRSDQILITNGAVHAVDLLLRLLTGPGDRVLTELPTYPGALDVIARNRARPVPVPLAAAGGWNVDRMTATLRQSASRLAYLMPDHQNPTGALVGDDERRAVLRAARDTGTTVVVDETFAELGFGAAARPAAAFDPSVISVGSLSKLAWAGLRVGWVRAQADVITRLTALRASVDMGGAVLEQLIATDVLADVDALRAQRLAELLPRRDALVAAVADHAPAWSVRVPDGGLSTWVELDAPLSTPLSMLALPAGVVVLPGPRWGVDGTLERFVRLPYSLPPQRLAEAVRRLAAVWATLTSSGAGGAAGARRAGDRALVVA